MFRRKNVCILLLFLPSLVFCQTDLVNSIIEAEDWIYDGNEKEAYLRLDSLEGWCNNKSIQDSLVALGYHELGKVYFNTIGDNQKAIQLFDKALTIRKRIFGNNNLNVSLGYFNIGLAKSFDGLHKEALSYFDSVTMMTQDDTLRAEAFLELGHTYSEFGELQFGEENIRSALALLKKIGQKELQAKAHQALGILLDDRGMLQEALLHYSQAISLTEDIELKTGCYANKGITYQKALQLDSAMYFYKRAEKNYEKLLKFDPWYLGPAAQNYNNIGILERKQQQYANAHESLQKALDYRKKIQQNAITHFSYASIFNNLGDLYLDQKDLPKALQFYQQSLLNVLPEYRDSEILSVPEIREETVLGTSGDLLVFLKGKARALYLFYLEKKDKSYLQAALNTYDVANQLIDKMRHEHVGNTTKLFWRTTTRDVFEQAVAVAYELGDKEKVFEFVEKSKAVLLLDALKEDEARAACDLPTSIWQLMDSLQNQITSQEMNTSEDGNSVLIELRNQRKKLVDRIAKEAPRYFRYKFDTEVLRLQDVQQKVLDDHTTLLEYFVSDNHIYTIKISKENSEIFQSSKAKNFKKKVNEYFTLISSPNAFNEGDGYEQFVTEAHDWYQQLIAPLKVNNTQLIIIPDGLLNYIPFETLLKENSFSEENLMIGNHHLNYAYSVAILSKNKERSSNADQTFLGMAPVKFVGLDLLENTADEVNSLAEKFSGTAFLYEKATKTQFIKHAPSYRIIHLATHASAGDEEQPWIAFADERLYLSELYDMNLNAEMIILSACETGSGRHQIGEGVMSMARGIAFAGTPSVLSSLWPINDKATVDLMQSYYDELIKGAAKDAALRTAKLQFIKNSDPKKHNPYFWASFLHIGDSDPLAIEASVINPLYLFLMIGLGALLFFIFRFFRK